MSYSTVDSTYSQNFDSLPTDAPNNVSLQGTGAGQYSSGWQDDTTTVTGTRISLPGWYLYYPITTTTEGGFNNHQRFRMGPAQNTGSFWGFGSSSSDSEKALGSIGSTTTAANGENFYIALRLINDTGSTLNSFTVTYDGEEWRDGQATFGETLLFGYSLTATLSDWTNAGPFTAVAALNFTSPVVAGTSSSGTAVNGNVEGLVANITATINDISWAPGGELWLRWADPQLASNADDGLAIDNLRFSAAVVPEPSSFALVGLGIAGLFLSRRTRKP